ncbi:hypothetical protein Glove_306g70 [Diversispora epigaea]|uniref:Uncharacterized protein n=1 Tax=Diversispora epigaea TaxID=1348612 RepID=A0A397HUC2_9GLOM|nr:hypothetical protein Glove_306g70 [Diversispora epigaea]
MLLNQKFHDQDDVQLEEGKIGEKIKPNSTNPVWQGIFANRQKMICVDNVSLTTNFPLKTTSIYVKDKWWRSNEAIESSCDGARYATRR